MRARAEHCLLAAALVLGLGLTLGTTPAIAADDLGTLFTTPQERAKLDRLRRGEPAVTSLSADEPAVRPSELSGFVQRSDGRNTVWIDGVPTATRSPKAAPLLDPREVQGAMPRDRERLRVEKAPAR